MKNKKVVLEIFVIILIIIGCFIVLHFYNNSSKKSITCLKAIENVYSSEIAGIALTICKTTDLRASIADPYYVVTGCKEDNFSTNSRDGVKLWAAKQMFLSLGGLKVIKDDYAEGLIKGNADLYLIQTNQDFADKKEHEIRYIYMFLNASNYHVFIPKNYCEPKDLINYSDKYIEYEPNEITKTLIDLILETKSW